jgi:diaminopimelate epimerase
MSALRVVKGHGTENDFVLLPDLDGLVDLTDSLVRALCDRHSGVGGDGVLRIVRSEHHREAAGQDAPFFMDYRNADASIAEMCGNGVRVFARWLHREGLVGDETEVATRGGVKPVRFETDGNIAVGMGPVELLEVSPDVTVGSVTIVGRALQIPNPHVVVELPSVDQLDALDLSGAPQVEPALPTGQNVEFVVRTGPRSLSMRVHERGVGETRSCGTGICAAVIAVAAGDGDERGDGQRWDVDVPGGRCWVSWAPDGNVELCGPAVLVGDVELDDAWLSHALG